MNIYIYRTDLLILQNSLTLHILFYKISLLKVMKSFTENLLKQFFIEIFHILREMDTSVIEIWLEFSKIPFLNQFKKTELKEFIAQFNFLSLKKGNYQFYIVINKILFIIEAFKISELDIRQVSEIINHSGFEIFVQEILSKNGYKTIRNFRFSDKSNFKSKTLQKRYEIDIVGIYSKYILIIDAKQWKRKDSFGSINKAADLQYQRAIALKKNPEIISKIIQDLLGGKSELKKRQPFLLIPMMVTLEDNSNRLNSNQIPLVSIYELNSFLLELHNNLHYFKIIKITKLSMQQKII